MCLVSVMGIVEYVLDISRDANLYVGSTVVSFKDCINCVVFFMLNVYGREVNWLIFSVNSFDNIYMLGRFALLKQGG